MVGVIRCAVTAFELSASIEHVVGIAYGIRGPVVTNNDGSQIATAIEQELGHPILTTSVPAQDDDYRCEPELIAEAMSGSVDIVVDSGRGGLIPSTVVDCTGDEPEIIRQGKGELNI